MNRVCNFLPYTFSTVKLYWRPVLLKVSKNQAANCVPPPILGYNVVLRASSEEDKCVNVFYNAKLGGMCSCGGPLYPGPVRSSYRMWQERLARERESKKESLKKVWVWPWWWISHLLTGSSVMEVVWGSYVGWSWLLRGLSHSSPVAFNHCPACKLFLKSFTPQLSTGDQSEWLYKVNRFRLLATLLVSVLPNGD